MKRKIALLLLSLCLLLGLSAPVFAATAPVHHKEAVEVVEETVTFSQDLMRAQLGEQSFVRADVSQLSGYYDRFQPTVLTEEQKLSIKDAQAILHSSGIALQVDFTYYDNAQLTAYYIDEAQQAEYQKLLEQDTATAAFRYPSYSMVDLSLSAARGEETILFRQDLYKMNQFEVVAVNNDGLEVHRGALLVDTDVYYFFDFAENGTTDVYGLERAKAWLITDEATCAALDQAMEEYYGEGLGFLEDDDFSEKVSKVFLIIVFVVLPGIALALFVFLAIRAKTPTYRKLFINLCAWSALVLIFVGIITWVVNSY